MTGGREMPGNDGGNGLFHVVWGLWATGFGWIVAANFRGAADRFYVLSQRSVPLGGNGVPRVGVGFFRVLAGVFALVGPVVLAVGVLGLSRGELSGSRFPQPPAVFAVAAGLAAAFGLWTLWRRSGVLRREWNQGSGPRRAAVVVLTLAVLSFPVGLSAGHRVAALASWLIGGFTGLTLLLGDGRGTPRADRPGRGGAAGQ
ncbi:hypothetical protein [Streptomyces lycii]|uniref:hypothetical protein n=1 Tax=Streptomyces lycii TaxID=2654337 RepID=UPI001F260ABC|nr:hypothetical protein [Streptomyces lycii]